VEDERVALNAIGLAQICLVHTVNLGQLDVLVLESGSCLLVMGSKSFAVPTPEREKKEGP
jgi:hypothetical protein